jgi:hypothetical protein
MTVKKPLVITAGQIEQLQAGDRLDLSNSATKTNNTGNALVIGTPVYVNGANVLLARANAQSTIRVAGLVADVSAPDAGPVTVIVDGVVTATTGQWDTITGQTGGLTPGADYWLSAATAGKLVSTAPTTDGEFVVPVGHALSATEFELEVGRPVKL